MSSSKKSVRDWMNVIYRSYNKEQLSDLREFQNHKTVQYMDEKLPEDIVDILEISAMLEIREFDIFSLAYCWWFGREPTKRVLENHFAKYMFNKIVPPWVRQYSRLILDLRANGKLNREELGITSLPSATKSVRTDLRYAVILFLALALLILMATVIDNFVLTPCYFLPCY